MKQKALSFVSFVLSVIMVLSLSSCKNGGSKAVVTTDVSLGKPVEDGAFGWSVLRSKEADSVTENLAKDLRNAIRLNFKCTARFSKDTTEYDKNAKEIIVGDTTRPESAAALKIIENNRKNNSKDFIVKVDGNKIVINAFNTDALTNAVNFFSDTFCKNEDTWYYLSKDYQFLYAPTLDSANHTIAGEALSSYKIITAAQNSRIIMSEIDAFTDSLFDNAGLEMTVADDSAEPADYEIIIGDTNRTEKVEKPKSGNYTIAVVGKKLVINAGDDASLAGAVKKISAMYSEALANKTAMVFADGYSVTEKYDPGKDGYKYVWGDEFNGSELNRKLWVNSGSTYETVSCLGSKCMARKSEDCYVKNGNAVIFATHDPKTDNFTHRQISTDGTHKFLYGVMEFRAKLAPAPAANALWFHVTPLKGETISYKGTGQEIDLLEDFGNAKKFAANVHRWWDAQIGSGHTSLDGGVYANPKQYKVPEGQPPLSDDYHIFSYQWTPDVMNFCVDGKVFFSYDIGDDVDGKGTDIFNMPMSTLMSTTLGASTYGAKWTREDKDYYEILIDYVRLYQRDSDNGYSMEKQLS